MLPVEALDVLSHNCDLILYDEKEAVIEQGNKQDDAMYIIVYGTVGVYMQDTPDAGTLPSLVLR